MWRELRKWSIALRRWLDEDIFELFRPTRSRIENGMKVAIVWGWSGAIALIVMALILKRY